MDSGLTRLSCFPASLDGEGGGGRELEKLLLYPIFTGAGETRAGEAEHSPLLGFGRRKIFSPLKQDGLYSAPGKWAAKLGSPAFSQNTSFFLSPQRNGGAGQEGEQEVQRFSSF